MKILDSIRIAKISDLFNTRAHLIKHAHNLYFIPFVSSGLGMCDRLNYLVCAVIRGSLICPIKLPVCYMSFASFNAPCNSVSSEISDLCEISDLFLFVSYFASWSKGIMFGVYFFDVCYVN